MKFLYKWLPILCGCHRRADRSFFYKGKQFPVCARCTGEILGIVIGFVLWFIKPPTFIFSLCLLIPMIIDGFLQLLTSYESHNITRLITGTLFGIGFISVIIISHVYIFEKGYHLGQKISTSRL